MSNTPTIVLVGHCGPDEFMLRSAITRVVKDAVIEMAHDEAGLEPHLGPHAVLLVNRVLDGRFANRSGIELIRKLGEKSRSLLISDIAEAQDQAASAGALPGFGKTQLYDSEMARKLTEAVLG